MFYIKLALASLFNNRRQYSSLFLVCVVGVTIMISAVTITDGMLRSVRQKARQYYGGDLQFMGGNYSFDITNASEIIKTLEPYTSDDAIFYSRFEYDAHNSSFYYEGERVRQRIFKGVDFKSEENLFAQFTFVEGGVESVPERNTAVISKPIAEKLGVHAGDKITVQVYTIYGYTNTMNLIVTGIFQDSSLFGMYTSYIDIQALRKVTGYPENYTNRICIYYKNGAPSREHIQQFHKRISGIYNMFELTDDKSLFYNALYDSNTQKPLYALIPLDANLKDLQVLIEAIQSVIILIIVILMAIISVGIGSTYRVIVMKRITEIGIYRALGMKPVGVRHLFLDETFFLLLAGFFTGIAFAAIITTVLSKFNFSFIPAFDIFLTSGHLIPFVKIEKLLGLLGIISVTTLLSVLFTIRNAVHISPVGAFAATA